MTYPVLAQSQLPVPAVQKVKKPEPHWLHIAGIHVEAHGEVAIVWLGIDREGANKQTGKITLYDSHVYQFGAHLAVIADGIKQRGDWKPVAWHEEDEVFVKGLRDRGVRTLFSGYKETPQLCEVAVRELDERLVNGSFKVLDTNTRWMHEFENFGPKDGAIPQENYPMMSATRHALHFLKSARNQTKLKRERIEHGGSIV